MIWLVGHRGMLGTEVQHRLQAAGLKHCATDLDVDISERQSIQDFTRDMDLAWIINCSAYTAVDKAEEEPDKAFRINADGVRNLALLAKDKGARLLHVSTDYVFDGAKEGAYLEEDAPNPLGVYGRSKLQGEQHIRAIIERHLILRTAWLYGPAGNNFVQTMLRLFQERDEVRVVADQWGSPTLAGDLADVILQIVTRERPHYGTFHFTNEGLTNWFDFASLILNLSRRHGLIDREVGIVPITTDQYPTKAVRPPNSSLSKQKIKEVFKISIRSWQEALESFMVALAASGKSPQLIR